MGAHCANAYAQDLCESISSQAKVEGFFWQVGCLTACDSLIFSEATRAGIMTVFKNRTELEQYIRGLNPNYDQYAKDLWKNGVTSTSQLGNASPATLIACGVTSPLHAEDIIAQSKATGHLQTVVVDKTARKYEPVEDEISLAGVVDMLLWHIWRCIDMYDQGPKLGEDKTSEAELEKALEELSTKLKEWGAAVHGKVEYLLCYACAGSQFQMRAEEEHQVYTSCVGASPSHQWDIPERKQLAGTLLKDAVVTIHNNFSQGMSKAKQGVTVAFDNWTDNSHNQLLAVTVTTSEDPRKVFTKKTINITSSPKTGDKTFEHMKEEIQELESHNKVTVICVVSDAAGEASKARRLLREWKPSLMTLDCYCHQSNLSVGDYLNSKKTNHMYLEEKQIAVDGKTTSLILPVVTRWGSHYAAIIQLLKTETVMKLLALEKKADLIKSVGQKKPAKDKAEKML
ncbi:hypothetical protein WJX77_001588 [Trebouxia sp. C0004]